MRGDERIKATRWEMMNLLPVLVILFVALPLIDLWLLFQVGQWLTFWPTLGLVILTGAVGAAIAKRQGISTIQSIQRDLSQGVMPTKQLGEGLLILLAAAVLITPGFVTDGFGILLLIPPFRRLFLRGLTAYFASRIHVYSAGAAPAPFMRVETIRFDDGGDMKYVRNEALDRERTTNESDHRSE